MSGDARVERSGRAWDAAVGAVRRGFRRGKRVLGNGIASRARDRRASAARRTLELLPEEQDRLVRHGAHALKDRWEPESRASSVFAGCAWTPACVGRTRARVSPLVSRVERGAVRVVRVAARARSALCPPAGAARARGNASRLQTGNSSSACAVTVAGLFGGRIPAAARANLPPARENCVASGGAHLFSTRRRFRRHSPPARRWATLATSFGRRTGAAWGCAWG